MGVDMTEEIKPKRLRDLPPSQREGLKITDLHAKRGCSHCHGTGRLGFTVPDHKPIFCQCVVVFRDAEIPEGQQAPQIKMPRPNRIQRRMQMHGYPAKVKMLIRKNKNLRGIPPTVPQGIPA
jgi:hypothetical protein